MTGNKILFIAALIAIIFSLTFALDQEDPEMSLKDIRINELELLQESYNSSTTEFLIDDINFALENNQMTLEELEINQTEYDIIKTEALKRSEADSYLQILKGTSWRLTAEICVGYIQRNIDANVTSWERLGENRSSIDKLYMDAWEREPAYALETLKATNDYYTATHAALTIRQDVAANITT